MRTVWKDGAFGAFWVFAFCFVLFSIGVLTRTGWDLGALPPGSFQIDGCDYVHAHGSGLVHKGNCSNPAHREPAYVTPLPLYLPEPEERTDPACPPARPPGIRWRWSEGHPNAMFPHWDPKGCPPQMVPSYTPPPYPGSPDDDEFQRNLDNMRRQIEPVPMPDPPRGT